MKRPVGVTISAVVALLGALLMLLVCVLECAVFLQPGRPLPPEARLGLYLGLPFFGGLGTWGTVTAIGLFRFRNWARISISVFSALLAFAGLVSAPVIMLIPPPPTALPANGPASFATIRMFIAVFYAVLGLWGGLWLYYFCRRSTREAFGEVPGAQAGGRPLSISIIGWWLLLSGVMAVVMAPFRLPGSVMIWILTGWVAALWYLAYGGLFVYIGYGLLRLKPLARTIAIVALCYGAVNGLVFFLSPGADARLATFMSRFSMGSQPPPFRIPGLVYAGTAAISVVIPLWFLITRKSAFQPSELPVNPQSQ